MTRETWHWGDAEHMARWLATRQTECAMLHLVARLPFLEAATIGPLVGLGGGGHLYRRLGRLAAMHLIDFICPVLQPRRNSRLFYLTDLGLATLAVFRQVDPTELARRNRLRSRDLLERMPRLPLLLACYEILAALALSRPEAPRLRVWECPWRRRFQPATVKEPVRISVPAGVTLAWDDSAISCLLLPDLGGSPVRAFRATLDRLIVLRSQQRAPFPTLVVATRDQVRAAIWHDVLEEVRGARRDAPLAARVVIWSELRSEREASRSGRTWRWLAQEPEPDDRRSSVISGQRLVPRLIGDLTAELRTPVRKRSALGRVALDLTPGERSLLDLVAHHPFLSTDDLALALGCAVASVRRRCDRLGAVGLLRVLPREETGETTELVELTRSGLTLVAQWQGLSLGIAVRWNGLAGGGPGGPIGTRQKLL